MNVALNGSSRVEPSDLSMICPSRGMKAPAPSTHFQRGDGPH